MTHITDLRYPQGVNSSETVGENVSIAMSASVSCRVVRLRRMTSLERSGRSHRLCNEVYIISVYGFRSS
jgi:hypothetical protein